METRESLSKLRVVDLKQRLSQLGLPLNGELTPVGYALLRAQSNMLN